jgi:hypothetical protein
MSEKNDNTLPAKQPGEVRLFEQEGFNTRYCLAPRVLVPLTAEVPTGGAPKTPAPKAPTGSAGQNQNRQGGKP